MTFERRRALADEQIPLRTSYLRVEGLCEMLLKGLIFDLDGVLVDTVPAHYEAWRRMFTEYGYEFGPREYREQVDGLRRLEGARAVMRDAPAETVAQAADLKNRYYLELIDQGRFNIFESSVRFVRQCEERGCRLAAASSSMNVRHILEKAGILDAFPVVIGGNDVVDGKPHPEIFLTAMPFGVAPAAIQEMMPNRMRAQASAVYLFVVNLVGMGLGATAIAVVTDYVFGNPAHLRYSMLLVGAVAGTVSIGLLRAGMGYFRESLTRLENWNADEVFLRNRPYEAAVLAAVTIVAHDEKMALWHAVGIVPNRESRMLDADIVDATVEVFDIDRRPLRFVLRVL